MIERMSLKPAGECPPSALNKSAKGLFKGFLQNLVCSLLLISGFSTSTFAEPVLTLVSGDMVSGFYHSPQKTGLIDELLEEALGRMGYELRVMTVPAERSLKMAATGIVDGDLLRTPAIEKHFPTLLRVPETLMEGEFVVFSREPFDVKEGWNALAEKSVGIVIGMKIIEINVPESVVVTRLKNEKQLFSMLKKGRIDHAVFIRNIGQYYLNKNNIKGLVASDQSLDSVPAYVYLHPKHAALVPRLARELQDMKQEGSFQVLVDKHLQAISEDYGSPKNVSE